MTIGAGGRVQAQSYVALFNETTTAYGTAQSTGNTNASFLQPLSITFKKEIEKIKVDSISQTRDFAMIVDTSRSIAGTLEMYLHPQESTLLLMNAMGGAITISTLSAAGSFTHSYSAGDFVGNTVPSLTFKINKAGVDTWQYLGGKVNTLVISAESGEPARVTFDMIFKDSTNGAAGSLTSTAISVSSIFPYTFAQGEYKYGSTTATAVVEKIQSFELTLDNGLVSDTNARALGLNVLDILPATRRSVELSVRQRIDTTSTYERFNQHTQGTIQLKFTGNTISASPAAVRSLTINLHKVYVRDAEPVLDSPSDILMADVLYDCIDPAPNTTTGGAISMTMITDQGTSTVD